jgi:hypothetical protein
MYEYVMYFSRKMWKTREGVDQPNENLKNTIEKETTYRTNPNSNGSFVKIKQILSETTHSFDIPSYLLYFLANLL